MAVSDLNFTELFRRIGAAVGGDTEVDLSRTARLSIAAGDLSHLVPPIAVPVSGASVSMVPGAGNPSAFSLQCISPGGLFVLAATSSQGFNLGVFITEASPFGALNFVNHQDLAFGQSGDSRVGIPAVPAPPVAPANAPEVRGASFPQLASVPIFLGPGRFLNFEDTVLATNRTVSLFWQEIPAAQRLP